MKTKPPPRRRRIHGWSISLGFLCAWILYYVLQVSAFADWMVGPLMRPDTAGPADAIVVLGAGHYEPCGPNVHSLRRTFLAERLYREGRGTFLLFTGGPTETSGGKSVGHEMAELTRRLGVPPEAILEETASHTTWENATLATPMLRERGARRILLVTDGVHMRRAEACFLHFGFEVERASVPQVCVNSSNLEMLKQAFHEYGGWLSYSLKGRLSIPGKSGRG